MQQRLHSDGLARTLFCLFVGLTAGYVGAMAGSYAGGFLFPPSPESDLAVNGRVVLTSTLFLLFGVGGTALCRKMTAGWPSGEPSYQNVGTILPRTRWLAVST